jgi:hypothetical protein
VGAVPYGLSHRSLPSPTSSSRVHWKSTRTFLDADNGAAPT